MIKNILVVCIIIIIMNTYQQETWAQQPPSLIHASTEPKCLTFCPSKLSDEQLQERIFCCFPCGVIGGIGLAGGISTTTALAGLFATSLGTAISLAATACCGFSCFIPCMCYGIKCEKELKKRKDKQEKERIIKIRARVDSLQLDRNVV